MSLVDVSISIVDSGGTADCAIFMIEQRIGNVWMNA